MFTRTWASSWRVWLDCSVILWSRPTCLAPPRRSSSTRSCWSSSGSSATSTRCEELRSLFTETGSGIHGFQRIYPGVFLWCFLWLWICFIELHQNLKILRKHRIWMKPTVFFVALEIPVLRAEEQWCVGHAGSHPVLPERCPSRPVWVISSWDREALNMSLFINTTVNMLSVCLCVSVCVCVCVCVCLQLESASCTSVCSSSCCWVERGTLVFAWTSPTRFLFPWTFLFFRETTPTWSLWLVS